MHKVAEEKITSSPLPGLLRADVRGKHAIHGEQRATDLGHRHAGLLDDDALSTMVRALSNKR
ncbi:hypothetical protein [Paraburkholderia youngii]|uniref:hypothetical protein n=1 Tax=Paraburkholderia youngii TaxID=2782701 RepID=UPI003D19E5C5